ncbi:MAG: signal peptidase II [Alphaproteobacteria bacterium]|nr:signal peptidase II [Alphaproteobacteria bacterium]MBN2675491.1 signal peptidase II [Alphaproteobacteria bacterium]
MKNAIKVLLIIIGVILLDQITKGLLLYLITGGVPVFGPAWNIVPVPYMMGQVTDFFNIVFTWNPGASFSMFRSLGESAPIIIIVLTGIVIGFLLHYLFNKANKHEKIPIAFIVGGALGNLIDRIRFGAVVDFLDFHVGGLHWPAFNIADTFIAIGVGLYIISWFIIRKKK